MFDHGDEDIMGTSGISDLLACFLIGDVLHVISKTRLFKYIENFTSKTLKIFR